MAGSDSGGGAGVQADLKTFAARGVYGASVVTALTAQSTRGVQGALGVPPTFVRAQIDAVLDDLGADAIKVGMLGNRRVVEAVAEALAARRTPPVVVDPVMVAKGGERLLAADAIASLRARLLPLADVVTPNLAEAAELVGFPVASMPDMEAAARALVRLGARSVVVTGGHLEGDAVDLVAVRGAIHRMRARRLAIAPHGTGCTFSAALAAELAKGASIEAAARAAKRYTTACIRRARRVGAGHPVLGHFPDRS